MRVLFTPIYLNSAHFIINDNKVAHFKWLIKEDHKIIEQVAEDVLRGQRNSHSADTQTSNNRCNIISQIIYQKYKRQGSTILYLQ